MTSPFVLLLIGFAYVILFGGLSLLRREELSARFVVEAILITTLFGGLAAFTALSVHPVLFLILLYLVTMRVRLLVDLGTIFARQHRFLQAGFFYDLAAHLWPDQAGRLVLDVNRGTAFLQSGKLEEAVALLIGVLEKSGQGRLGIKYEVAARYNLGVAYLRQNKASQAATEFNAVLDTWPASEYARRAASALEKQPLKSSSGKGDAEK